MTANSGVHQLRFGSSESAVRRAVFLDRDGVINRKAPAGQYITAWEQVEFLPGVAEALRELKLRGFLLIIVTNQSAISRKKLTVGVLETIHQRIAQQLGQEGAGIDAVYYCPHEPSADCQCRKPRPRMLQQAAKERGIDLSRSWMVGDAASDIEAGHAAGCRTIWLRPPDFNDQNPPTADFSTDSIRAAAAWILSAASTEK